jgi:hypothetical protein
VHGVAESAATVARALTQGWIGGHWLEMQDRIGGRGME